MRVVTTIAAVRRELDAARGSGVAVGLVPTMGSLHAGHLSLAERAVAECGFTAMTVFVNPLQFGPGEDFGAYPRDLERDRVLAEKVGVDLVFAPPVEEMYPGDVLTTVSVADLTAALEGAARPGHFDGVTTVVAKLYAIAGSCRVYFGEKDYQQLQVVRRMAADLSFPVEVVACPTVREPDGLALSSRNGYLSPEERAAAPVLQRALREGATAIEEGGERDPEAVRRLMTDRIEGEPLARLDYAEVVDAATLQRIDPLEGEVRLLSAARFGKARLIDNVGATARERHEPAVDCAH
ncbi:MAG: pantoate--beta-alanine ligase [Acidimicrobiales bacterium]